MASYILECSNCGQKNRIPDRCGTARCGRCKNVLATNKSPNPLGGFTNLLLKLSGVAAIIAICYVFGMQKNISYEREQPRAAKPQLLANASTKLPDADLTPVAAKTGFLKWPTGAQVAPFTIKTTKPYSYYVRLFNQDAEEIMAEIFVVGGETFTGKLPLGRYLLRYASGATWYGAEARFGHDTIYSKATEVFDFQEIDGGYEGYTIELIWPHGNLRTVWMPVTNLVHSTFGPVVAPLAISSGQPADTTTYLNAAHYIPPRSRTSTSGRACAAAAARRLSAVTSGALSRRASAR